MRTLLMDGVRQRLRYWGFGDGPEPTHEVESIEGGYLFRGEVHSGEDVPTKWRALKNAVNRHGVENVVEEAAATWFNRLMAIRILEKNGHEMDVLAYAQGTRQPVLLHNARQGILPYGTSEQKSRVQKAVQEGDDDAAFRTLLTAYCNNNDLLKDVFGRVSDYTELLLPMNLLDREGPVDVLVTTEAISDEDYAQVELIGWLYQFYISEKKDAVYDKSGKFEPEDIPAATQIFTPNWIVKYLVENTVGRLWLDKHPDSDLREEMDYLVEPEDDEPQEPLFDDLAELQLFDPAAGSGHILVEGFDLLMKMYREEGYTVREAVEQILTENLRGMEIDRRAAQLARFALLMKAAQHDSRVLQRGDLRPEVYAMPEPRTFSTGDLRAYFGDDVFDQYGAEIQEALDQIAEHGQNVGSALQFDLSDEARAAVADRVAYWDAKDKGQMGLGEQELAMELRGYLKPLLLLTEQYPAVAANPPYMGSRKMNGPLKSYLKNYYPRSKKNLFAVFIELMLDVLVPKGRLGTITMESWMFLSSFEDLRYHLLDNYRIQGLAHFGWGILGIEFGTAAALFQNALPDKDTKAEYSRLEEDGINPETGAPYTFPVKDNDRYAIKAQQDFEKIPGAPIAYWVPEAVITAFEQNPSLADIGKPRQGLATGDNNQFLRHWPEVSISQVGFGYESRADARRGVEKWFPYNKGGGYRKWYGNLEFVVNWKNDGRAIRNFTDANGKQRSRPQNTEYYFKEGITWSDVSSGDFACRHSPGGLIFDVKGSSAFPDEEDLFSVMGYLNSTFVTFTLHVLNPTMSYQVGDIRSLPYKRPRSGKKVQIESTTKACVRLARQDFDSRETSWDFTQHPLVQQTAPSIREAYHTWKQQATDDFFQLHANEEELNELFIDLYGLENELSPRVALDDITILEDELDRNALEDLDDERDDLSDDELREQLPFKPEVPIRRFLSYGIGVMLGRYRLGKDGLHIAHPNPSADELADYEVPTPLAAEEPTDVAEFTIDDDAILPLMGQDSPFSDDAVYRMREILRLVWGADTFTENLNFINRCLSIGRSRGLKRDYEKTMEEWLVGDFWDWHKSLYSVNYYGKKPIYWLFQSPEGHFQVLVYMHRMNPYTVQQVRQQYLHKYQQYLRSEIESLESRGEKDLSSKESKRLNKLRDKADDARDYDAILKEVADQQIEIDLDDGVQENYPKFGDAVAAL
jgi:hypothetical protein